MAPFQALSFEEVGKLSGLWVQPSHWQKQGRDHDDDRRHIVAIVVIAVIVDFVMFIFRRVSWLEMLTQSLQRMQLG